MVLKNQAIKIIASDGYHPTTYLIRTLNGKYFMVTSQERVSQ